VFHLLLKGLTSKEDFSFELDKALGWNGRYQSKNINPEHINKSIVRILLNKNNINTSGNNQGGTHLHIKQGLDIKDHELFDKINTSNEEFIDLWCSDKNFGNLVILKYLEESGRLDNCMVKDQGHLKSVSIDLMNEVLNENDWVNMVNLYYKYKKEMVEIMIDVFVTPDDYCVDDINPTPIKDLLISRVNRLEENNLI